MLARKRLLTAIFIGTGMVAIAMVSSAKVVCAQPVPDLAVSMNAVPNPVPYGMGYAVQILVSNLAPLPVKDPTMPGPTIRPGAPGPPPPTIAPPQGGDVQLAELLISALSPPWQRLTAT